MASVKLLSWAYVRQGGGLFLGVWYAHGIGFRRFRTLPIFDIILDIRHIMSTQILNLIDQIDTNHNESDAEWSWLEHSVHNFILTL